jgi:hypothetical protein
MLERTARFPLVVIAAGAALASLGATACGPMSYVPKPSPRIQVMSQGSSFAFVRDGRPFKLGPLGGGLDEVVRGNPRAEEEARSFETKTTSGFVFSILGAASAGAGSGLFVANELSNSPSRTMTGVSLALLGSGLVFALVGSVVMANATPHIWNAVNIYNDSLPPPYGAGYFPVQGYAVPPPGYGAPPPMRPQPPQVYPQQLPPAGTAAPPPAALPPQPPPK